MQGMGVCPLIYLAKGAPGSCDDILRIKGKDTRQSIARLLIIAHKIASRCQHDQSKSVPGIQFARVLEIADRLGPATLPTVNYSRKRKNLGIIRQCLLRQSKFGAGVVEIEISIVEMRGEGEMRLAGIWFQSKRGIDGRLRQGETSGCAIDFLEVHLVMGRSQPAIGEKEGRIARDRLIEQIHRGIEIFLAVRTVSNRFDQWGRTNIKVVRGDILRWLLFNRLSFNRGKFRSQLVSDRLCYFGLNGEDICQNAIVGLRPEMLVSPCIN